MLKKVQNEEYTNDWIGINDFFKPLLYGTVLHGENRIVQH